MEDSDDRRGDVDVKADDEAVAGIDIEDDSARLELEEEEGPESSMKVEDAGEVVTATLVLT